jgi:hypothetical protein
VKAIAATLPLSKYLKTPPPSRPRSSVAEPDASSGRYATRDSHRFLLGRLQDMFYAADRNYHPVGSIVQLIADLIDRFVQQIGLEQDLQVI